MAGKTLLKDMTGKKCGCLTVIERNGTYPGTKQAAWRCKCDCGNEATVMGTHLRRGIVTSCGCGLARIRAQTKHGQAGTPIYAVWNSMLARCNNPQNDSFRRYGGRGIKVCDRWLKFANFFADMGHQPDGKTLDRIDNNGNYEPGNVRWATRKEQANNRRLQITIAASSGTLSIKQAAAITGLCTNAIRKRIESGIAGDDLLAPRKKPGRQPKLCTTS